MNKPELDRLEALRKQAEQLKARLAKIEAKQAAQARKEDTRLKIIVGAALLADAKVNATTASLLREILPRAITAQRDRDLLTAKGWLSAK